MNFHKCDLTDEVLMRHFQSFSLTLDTAEYVPQSVYEFVVKRITKDLKQAFKKIAGEDKKYQRALKKQAKQEMRDKALKEKQHREQETSALPLQVGSTEESNSNKLCEAVTTNDATG